MIASLIFLGVSVTAVMIQSVALSRLLSKPAHPPSRQASHRGFVRTACLRVIAAVLYVLLALSTFIDNADALPLALVTFSVVQVAWWISAVLDVRLHRRIAAMDMEIPR